MSIKEIITNELSGWKLWELTWMFIACTAIVIPSYLAGNTSLRIICGACGAISVVLAGKGKLSCYLFGTAQRLIYAYIAYGAMYYGEVMLNVLYFFPLEFYGVYEWYRHMNYETHEVKKRRMSVSQRWIVVGVVIVATIVYGIFLKYLNGKLPYVDSLSTIVSIVAMIVTIKMYMEQWLLWMFINAVTVGMWIYDIYTGGQNIAILLMWSVYLINSVIMFFKWRGEVVGKTNRVCHK
ncbi:MAG: nicotinamide mononucleotide transporter [Marinilabiliaceae bacterium]|nr:nicotinamide mononucleotide transporter [Marinilabiliaceae bacterium]